MPVCALNNMISVGLFTTAKLQQIEEIAEEFEYAYIKAALNFGFLTRKQYVSFLERSGFPLIDIRNEVIDETFVSECDLLHLNAFLYLPIRNDGKGNLIIAAADPLDEKLLGVLEIKFGTKVKLVAASDLDITWMVHKFRGEFYVKEAVFSLMRKDPESSGLITFTDAQLVVIFSLIGIAFTLLTINFISVFIFIN
ncbi:MAG: glycosyl transferase, partial [Sphingobacteriia bacterium]